MGLLSKFEEFFIQVKQNKWIWYFSIFCRIVLAYAFLAGGYVKIIDERFASGLSIIHPMGSYLNALHHTGFYYTFIGIAQIFAAVLLLIPRTVFLGAILYFPIILNIFILSYAVRFDGSFLTSPLMVMANLFLLCWHYDRLKFILPITNPQPVPLPKPVIYHTNFPYKFFFGVAAAVAVVIGGIVAMNVYGIMPRNHIADCNEQFKGTNRTTAGANFCNCIHVLGEPLESCLKAYEKEDNDAVMQ